MILLIGYGNPLRGDDAIGQHVAQLLQDRWQRADVQVEIAYQLTPELVEPVSHSCWVVFIDARSSGKPGEIFSEIVEAQSGTGAFTHNVTPASLLSAAYDLYGALPAGLLISIAGESFDFGTQLSPLLNQSLLSIADQVQGIIETSVNVHSCEESENA